MKILNSAFYFLTIFYATSSYAMEQNNRISQQKFNNPTFLEKICKSDGVLLRAALDQGLSPNAHMYPYVQLLTYVLDHSYSHSVNNAKELVNRGAIVRSSHVYESIKFHDIELFTILLNACTDFDIEEDKQHGYHGYTLLHSVAARGGNYELVEKCMQLGYNIEAQDDKAGNTPLFEAILKLKIPAIRALIAHGANLHAKNKSGKTILMCAEQNSTLIAKNIKMHLRVQTYLGLGKQLPVEITDHIASFYK